MTKLKCNFCCVARTAVQFSSVALYAPQVLSGYCAGMMWLVHTYDVFRRCGWTCRPWVIHVLTRQGARTLEPHGDGSGRADRPVAQSAVEATAPRLFNRRWHCVIFTRTN